MAFLLDTNHLGACINPVSRLREHIQLRYRAGDRFVTCWPVLCELETGIVSSRKAESFRRTLDQVLDVVRIWPFDWHVIRLFGMTSLELQRRGRVVSQVDVMLAAFARHYSATILTTDKDFDALPDIKTENCLKT